MVYKAEYVIAVIQNGRIVPEQNGGVTLPYNSEYAIRLKNKSRQRSVADIYLDGAIAAKGVVVDADGTVDIARYIRPGDSMEGGAKFKLVRLSHQGVADKNDSQNGLLEVRFYKEAPKLPMPLVIKEKEYVPCPHTVYPRVWPVSPYRWPWVVGDYPWLGKTEVWCGTAKPGQYICGDTLGNVDSVHGSNCDWMPKDRNRTLHTKGLNDFSRGGQFDTLATNQANKLKQLNTADGPAATVQGGHVDQKFEEVHMDIDTTKFETLSLILRGVSKVTRHDKCPGCGHKRKGSERFCPKCGTALVVGE